MFILRLFKVAIVLVIYFDLKVKQFDVINVFMNVTWDTCSQTIACKLLDSFKKSRIYIEIDCVFYGLRDLLALWYKDFLLTLKKTRLSIYKEELCLFINKF